MQKFHGEDFLEKYFDVSTEMYVFMNFLYVTLLIEVNDNQYVVQGTHVQVFN